MPKNRSDILGRREGLVNTKDLLKELHAMREIGMRVPKRTFDYVRRHEAELAAYEAIKVSEMADLTIELADLEAEEARMGRRLRAGARKGLL